MPLTARLRDEENERINNLLKKLIGMDYVPEQGNENINALLSEVDLSLPMLLNLKTSDLIMQLQKNNFDWENAEQFADFLILISTRLPENEFSLNEKATVIYQYIQSESKTFSWAIQSKISQISKAIKDDI